MRIFRWRGVLAALSALMAGAALVPATAGAGAYDVQVCRNGYGNGGALTASGAPGYDWLMRVSNNCDGGWHGWNGISVSVNNGPESPTNDPYVPQGTSGNIYTQAPPGAGIRSIHVDDGRLGSYYGNTTGWNPRVRVPSLGWCRTDGLGGDWCNLGYQRPADNSGQTAWGSPDYPGYGNTDIGPITGNVSDLAIGVVCGGGSSWDARPCYRPQYKPAAGVAIVSAAITVVDDSPPAISAISGQLAAGGWNRPGAIGFGVTGWDNTGIQTFEKYVDGGYAGQADQPCNYGAMKPCEDRAINDAVSVGGYDGFHTVTIRARSATQYWLNCAVDCADTSVTVAIDGTAPDAPAIKNGGAAWTPSNAFNLNAPTPASENDPDGGGPQARSPIARRIATVCPADASSISDARCKTTDVSPVAGSNQPASAAVTAPGEGSWKVYVSLVDAVGNQGARSAPVQVNVDRTPPTQAVDQVRGGLNITSVDPLSAPANVTYRVDGKGDWVTDAGTAPKPDTRIIKVTATPGQHYVEVKGTDNAGNVSTIGRFDITVPNNDGNVKDLSEFGNDAQLAVIDRGEINGVGGGEKATLTAWFVKKTKSKTKKPNLSVRTIGEKNTAAIEGLLVDGAGKAIANARIDLGAAIAGGRTEIKKGAATTNGDGNFSIQLPKGQTSRDLTLAYMARVNDAKPAASAGLRLTVKARVSFTAHRPRVGKVKFTGFVSSGYLTKAGTRVEIQWWNPRAREWDPFGSVRTDQQGRWTWKRLFTARATYRMRAFVASNPAYAYKGGASRVKVVRVR